MDIKLNRTFNAVLLWYVMPCRLVEVLLSRPEYFCSIPHPPSSCFILVEFYFWHFYNFLFNFACLISLVQKLAPEVYKISVLLILLIHYPLVHPVFFKFLFYFIFPLIFHIFILISAFVRPFFLHFSSIFSSALSTKSSFQVHMISYLLTSLITLISQSPILAKTLLRSTTYLLYTAYSSSLMRQQVPLWYPYIPVRLNIITLQATTANLTLNVTARSVPVDHDLILLVSIYCIQDNITLGMWRTNK